MNMVDHLVRPLGLQELNDVVKIWVDCALKLSRESLEWMQRLYQRQLAIFGRPLEIASDQPVAEPAQPWLPSQRDDTSHRDNRVGSSFPVRMRRQCDVRCSATRRVRGEAHRGAIGRGNIETVGATVPGEPWLGLPRAQLATSDRLSLYAILAAKPPSRTQAWTWPRRIVAASA